MLPHVENRLGAALAECRQEAENSRTVTAQGDVRAVAQQVISSEVKKAIDDCMQRSANAAKFSLMKLITEAQMTGKAAGKISTKAIDTQMQQLKRENERVLAVLEYKRTAAEAFVSENKTLASELEEIKGEVQMYRQKLEGMWTQGLAVREKALPIYLKRARPAEAALEILALNFKPQKFADLSISLGLDTGEIQIISIPPMHPGAQIIRIEMSSFHDSATLQFTVVDSMGDALSNKFTVIMGDDNPPAEANIPQHEALPDQPAPSGDYYPQEVPARTEEEVQELAQAVVARFPTAGTIEIAAAWFRDDPTLTYDGACQQLIESQHQPDEAFERALQVQQHYPTVNLAEAAQWFRQDPTLTVEAVLSYLSSQPLNPQ